MSVHEISIRTTGRTQMIDISSQVAKALKYLEQYAQASGGIPDDRDAQR